jgi:hypothetical protein
LKNLLGVLCVALSLATTSFAAVSVSSPANGATIPGAVHVVASAAGSAPITAMRVYDNNNSAYAINGASINTYLSLAAGAHYLVVQAWDSAGGVYKTPLNITVSTSAPAPTPTGSNVTVSSPSNGATISGSVHVVASASAGAPITAMRVYDNSNSVYAVSGNRIDTYLALASGSHYLVAQAWDSAGGVYKTPVSITVSGSAPAPTPSPIPTGGTTIANIDQLTGWQSCTVCAGAGGTGPVASYSMTQFVGSPSMDGHSAVFWVGGTTPYSDALWWKQLGAQSTATNFVYDVYFYVANPSAPQALEFDVNQSVAGYKHIFGTQCNIRGDRQWDVWDGAGKRWVPTGITCNAPTAYAWHHLTWQFKRPSASQVTFVAFTLDGVTSYVNRTYSQLASSGSELNVAFQMDGNYAQQAYNVWLDKVSLRYW